MDARAETWRAMVSRKAAPRPKSPRRKPAGKKRRAGKEGASKAATGKYASSIDVARLAGVSQSAVSRTFTVGASVSPQTRKKVLKAAEALGYQPSMIPRIMLTHRSSLIAIAIGGMYNPYYAGVVELFTREIQKKGNSVLLFGVDHNEYIDEVVPVILGYRVDGLISALSILSPEAAESCAKQNVPVVLLNGKVRNDWVSSVCCDNVAGGRAVASLFIARGARHFGFIAGKPDNLANEDRLAGYFGRLVEAGVRDLSMAYGGYRYEGGFKACRELMAASPRPDAIFCANDLMAVGALEAIRSELSLGVPEDVMVAGFDDIPAAAWPSIALTTVRQEAARMVQESLQLLERKIAGQTLAGGALRLVPGTLVERGTTARPVGDRR
jgi:DNA-binding LacI/PurR family transcriptional regulator